MEIAAIITLIYACLITVTILLFRKFKSRMDKWINNNTVKPIKLDLTVMETLIMIDALNYFESDKDRHQLDRMMSKKIREKIKAEVKKGGAKDNG